MARASIAAQNNKIAARKAQQRLLLAER